MATEIADLLIDAGANIRLEGRDGNTPLAIAARKGKPAVISSFPAGNMEHVHCDWPNCVVAKRLVDRQYPSPGTPTLTSAILQKSLSKVNVFMNYSCAERNREQGLPDEGTKLPLHLSIAMGCDPITQMLLSSGRVDINKVDCRGCLPLHHACTVGNETLVGQLLPDTDDLFTESFAEETIGMVAATTTPDIMGLIFQRDPSAISRPSLGGVTSLHAAACYLCPDMVECILSKGQC